MGPHFGPFGCDVSYAGAATCSRVPAAVVIVRRTWFGVNSRKKILFVHPLVPGHASVWTLPDVPSIAWTVIGPAGAFWTSTVSPFRQPINVHTVL